ncbi:MAG: hypothetical protein ACRD5J_17120, partial [Nitrososphaeraceae archaeon]
FSASSFSCVISFNMNLQVPFPRTNLTTIWTLIKFFFHMFSLSSSILFWVILIIKAFTAVTAVTAGGRVLTFWFMITGVQ